jgi:uncharacterized protein YeaO (DUF488 family)
VTRGDIRLRRAYDEPAPTDGCRVLVDRLWPRGVSRTGARIDEWLRELAPSDDLRRWFGHAPRRWEEFRRRYRAELADHNAELDRLLELVTRGQVTLMFGARDQVRNNAVVLREIVQERRVHRRR